MKLFPPHEHCPKCNYPIRILPVGKKCICPHCKACLLRQVEYGTLIERSEVSWWAKLWKGKK